jgi:hypothetical protein
MASYLDHVDDLSVKSPSVQALARWNLTANMTLEVFFWKRHRMSVQKN